MQTYNTKIQTFPGVALAGPFGFSKREFFEIEDEADREVPKVSFPRRCRAPRGRWRARGPPSAIGTRDWIIRG